jgi:hypothetical protein
LAQEALGRRPEAWYQHHAEAQEEVVPPRDGLAARHGEEIRRRSVTSPDRLQLGIVALRLTVCNIRTPHGGLKMARKQCWVQYLDARWKVRHNQTTLSVHVVKQDAVDAGVKVAKANQPSELVICTMDGRIEDKRTYGADLSQRRADRCGCGRGSGWAAAPARKLRMSQSDSALQR